MNARYSVMLAIAAAALVTAPGALAQAVDRTPRAPASGAALHRQIQNDPVLPTIAPAGADVTLVLFSDYQCPYCRKVHPTIEQLRREDPKIRVVYRDWPIFGAISREAARAAIAVNYQGRHTAFNNALMQTQGRITSQSIRVAADRAGVNWARLQADLAAHGDAIDAAIARTGRFAATIGLAGTPALLIGRYLLPGAADLATMREAVAAARAGATD
ncbi:DsbA family protein [Sphingomonas sp.]|uniref:DsbA family protein n=1 Tax=Sphingomonas sp. TaxID=28214 RepID=UPI002628E108|nr:DsbA family protein [Sphingomonas sp.]MDF2495548.1 DsbA family protein [Sphingomonas sp.]